ncbi:MAG TPA: ATP-binding cassette domain-containing protein [Rubrivivax sp.]|nr:ATP-binding cassette domain-containing protein [Rubrivivax sp.]
MPIEGGDRMLGVQGLTRSIGGRSVVRELSFSMAPGEVLAVLGPSGSGKTSLLRMIAGFDVPTAGRIELRGACVSEPGCVRVPPERRGLALAFQDATLFPHLDAVDNAAFGIRGLARTERRARARRALGEMGLAGIDGRDVATLSGGEAQRVSLARALATDAPLLLLDEPFGNVDRLTRSDLVQRLRAVFAQGRGAIVVTHDPADVEDLGARVLLMREGRLVADSTHDAIRSGAQGDWARTFLAGGG